MTFVNRSGKLRYLRINDLEHDSAAPTDAIHAEVTAALLDDDEDFGFEMHDNDPNLASRQSMLTTLRDAFFHGRSVGLSIDLPEGEKHGQLHRVRMQ